jgi:proteasome accessory factor B
LKYRDAERLIEELLWYGDDVVLKSPSDLRAELIRRLQSGVKNYG